MTWFGQKRLPETHSSVVVSQGHSAYVLVNNRVEGNAHLTGRR
jgi:hypothetical protein